MGLEESDESVENRYRWPQVLVILVISCNFSDFRSFLSEARMAEIKNLIKNGGSKSGNSLLAPEAGGKYIW